VPIIPAARIRPSRTFADDVMMYAKTPDEIHEWIPQRRHEPRGRRVPRGERTASAGVLRMPAFKGRMSERAMDDLVAYVMAASACRKPTIRFRGTGWNAPSNSGLCRVSWPGREAGAIQPRLDKGYVPSWDGADFPELVRDSSEFRQWVEHGVSRRFETNPIASFFLRRAVLKCPPTRSTWIQAMSPRCGRMSRG